MTTSTARKLLRLAVLALAALAGPMRGPALAQDMLSMVDLSSDEFTKAVMTRADIEKGLAALKDGEKLDLVAKPLNGLDLSKMDLRRANLLTARLMGANLSGANLDGVNLDGVWSLNSDWTGASLKGASMFGTQLVGARLDGADLTGALVAGDFSKASMTGAKFDGANLSADEKNQSMGLMRGTFRSTNLEGATFRDANMKRVMLEFSSLKGADLTNAVLTESELAGADFTGADVTGVNFAGADVNSARIGEMKNAGKAKNLDKLKNLERAFRVGLEIPAAAAEPAADAAAPAPAAAAPAAPAPAFAPQKFDAAAFAEAQKAGKSIVVDVHAPWCSTCKAQQAILAELTAKPEYKDIVVLVIDFDSQKPEQKTLNVQARSTLIAFKGAKETGRSVADTKKDSIEALLKGAL
jgi:uncharacterized protein YjbI with pentapeptide repeats